MIPTRPVPAFSLVKSSDGRRLQRPFQPDHGRVEAEGQAVAREGGSTAKSNVLGWAEPAFPAAREEPWGAAGLKKECWGEKGGENKAEASAHCPDTTGICSKPNPSIRLGDSVQPALVLHLGHVPWSPFPSHRDPEGPDTGPRPPAQAGPPAQPGCSAQQLVTRVLLRRPRATCTELPL